MKELKGNKTAQCFEQYVKSIKGTVSKFMMSYSTNAESASSLIENVLHLVYLIVFTVSVRQVQLFCYTRRSATKAVPTIKLLM